MSFARYLLNFAYIGTAFRGSQRQVRGGSPRPDDPSTVQGVLEMGLKRLKPKNDVVVIMASRTDAGVHALNTTCHFDLHRSCDPVYPPIAVVSCLNKFFNSQNIPVRALNAKIVSNEFHCRWEAISRTYLYRIIGAKRTEETPNLLLHFFPIEERQRSFLFCYEEDLDIDCMRKAAKMFEGLHDFRTFMGKTENKHQQTRKEIFKIDVIQRTKEEIGVAYPYSWPVVLPLNAASDSHRIIDVYIKGKGFLYKQVRRTVGTLLTAATGRISLKDIQFMLQVPSKHSWIPVVKTLPGHGLYLCNIEYPPEN